MIQHYRNLPTPGLVEQFNAITAEQCEASWLLQTPRYNRLYRRMQAVVEELKSRDGDQRLALLPLLRSGNVQVRMMAAHALLSIAPMQARLTLESVRDFDEMPQAAEARISLRSLDEGTYIPR